MICGAHSSAFVAQPEEPAGERRAIPSLAAARIERLLTPSEKHLRVLPRPSFESTCRHLLLSLVIDYGSTGWPGGNKATAKQIGTNPSTAKRWFSSLTSDGLVERREGRWHPIADGIRDWLRFALADFTERGLPLTHGFLPRALLRGEMTPERLAAAAIMLGETFGNVSEFIRGDEERAQLANVSRRTIRAARDDLAARGIVRAEAVRRGRLTLTKIVRLPGCRVCLRLGPAKLDGMASRSDRARGIAQGCADAQRKGCADAQPSPQCPTDSNNALRGHLNGARAGVDFEQQQKWPTRTKRETARRPESGQRRGVVIERPAAVRSLVEAAATGHHRRSQERRKADQLKHARRLLNNPDEQRRAIEGEHLPGVLRALGLFDGSHLTKPAFGKLAEDYARNVEHLAECLARRRRGSAQAAVRDVLERAGRVFRNRNVVSPQAVLLHELCAELRRFDARAAAAARAAEDARHGLDRRTHGAIVGALMASDFATITKRIDIAPAELHELAQSALGDHAPSLAEITEGLANARTVA